MTLKKLRVSIFFLPTCLVFNIFLDPAKRPELGEGIRTRYTPAFRSARLEPTELSQGHYIVEDVGKEAGTETTTVKPDTEASEATVAGPQQDEDALCSENTKLKAELEELRLSHEGLKRESKEACN